MRSHYAAFAVQLLISAVFMYLLMYLMIASLEHFHLNLNALYMTAAMVAPMAIAMLLLMPSMYPKGGLNFLLNCLFAAMFVAGIWFTREQTFIDDGQFLRSMIPHHSGAILMCREAELSDPEIVELCGRIVRSQQEEITQMEAILQRY